MTTALIRQKLYEYIRVADEKKVKAIFTMVEDQVEDYDWTKDKEFLTELEKRSADYKSGRIKGVPWQEAKKQIIASQKREKEMMYQIELHPLAIKEMEESYQWYEERSAGLGNRFLAAIQKKFEHISEMPELYAKRKGNYREVSVQNFPFTIIYEMLPKEKIILVSYVFHTNRNPKLKYKR